MDSLTRTPYQLRPMLYLALFLCRRQEALLQFLARGKPIGSFVPGMTHEVRLLDHPPFRRRLQQHG